jgi:hypothetical protein
MCMQISQDDNVNGHAATNNGFGRSGDDRADHLHTSMGAKRSMDKKMRSISISRSIKGPVVLQR